jgi:hypothetical protein
MPRGLSLLTNLFLLFAFIFPAFSLICLLSYALGNHSINGVQLSFGDFWRRMQLLIPFGVGIYSALIAYGFLRATRWSRPLFVLPCVASLVLGVIHYTTLTLYGCLSSLVGVALPVWYLFFRHTVRDYYARAQQPVA